MSNLSTSIETVEKSLIGRQKGQAAGRNWGRKGGRKKGRQVGKEEKTKAKKGGAEEVDYKFREDIRIYLYVI